MPSRFCSSRASSACLAVRAVWKSLILFLVMLPPVQHWSCQFHSDGFARRTHHHMGWFFGATVGELRDTPMELSDSYEIGPQPQSEGAEHHEIDRSPLLAHKEHH